MDSDGEEEICELVDVLDMFIDSDFGDNDDFAGFVSDGDDEVLEADSDDDTGRYVSSFTSEKKVNIFSQMVGIIKNGKKNVLYQKITLLSKRKHGLILLSQLRQVNYFFLRKIITDKLIKDITRETNDYALNFFLNNVVSKSATSNLWPIDGINENTMWLFLAITFYIVHGPDEISVPPKRAKRECNNIICYIAVSYFACDNLSKKVAYYNNL